MDAIVEFVAGADELGIPGEVLERARDIFVDTLGCAVGGRGCPAARASDLFPTLPTEGGGGRVIGEPAPMAVDIAAFKNAAMIRYLDFNDLVPGNHPSDMLGGLLALTARVDCSGADFLRTMVVAYEVNARIARRFPEQPRWTVDSGYSVAIGLAAGGAFLLGLDAERTRHAVSFAATAGVPLRASRAGQLSHMKGFATALSVRDAVFHLHLAESGVTAPVAPFEGRHGLVELLTGSDGPFGFDGFDEWYMLRTRLKRWPVAYNAQLGVVGALSLRSRLRFEDVDRVVLRTNRFLWHESGSEVDKWDPRTRETADHSLPYVFCRALRDGTIDESSFTEGRIRDPEVLDLMQRVEVVPDAGIDAVWPDVFAIRVEATDTDGVAHDVYADHLPGHHATPLEPTEVEGKFLSLVRPHVGDGAERAFAGAWDVASAPAITAVLDLLVP